MKYLLVVFACCLLACGHARTPEKPVEPANLQDCENVYQYIITLTVQEQLDIGHTPVQAELDYMREKVDEDYIRRGSRGRFLASCQNTMTVAQVECSLKVDHLDDIHTCVTLIR